MGELETYIYEYATVDYVRVYEIELVYRYYYYEYRGAKETVYTTEYSVTIDNVKKAVPRAPETSVEVESKVYDAFAE